MLIASGISADGNTIVGTDYYSTPDFDLRVWLRRYPARVDWGQPGAQYPLLVVHRPSARALLEHELSGLHVAKFNRPRLDELDGLRQPNRLGRFLRRHQFDVRRRAILPAQAMKRDEPVKRYDFSRVGKSGQERNRVCAPARRFFNETMKTKLHSLFIGLALLAGVHQATAQGFVLQQNTAGLGSRELGATSPEPIAGRRDQ